MSRSGAKSSSEVWLGKVRAEIMVLSLILKLELSLRSKEDGLYKS